VTNTVNNDFSSSAEHVAKNDDALCAIIAFLLPVPLVGVK